MSNPTLRQISMLELIPRAPRKTYTKKLKAELSDRGYDVDERTIPVSYTHLRAHET